MALLRARELTKTYGSLRALDRVSFEIDEGITGLLGSNGAGKSTSLKLFLGLIEPDGGSAEVLGEDPRRSPEYRARVGYAPEHDCLPRNVSAAEFLAYMSAWPRGSWTSRRRKRSRRSRAKRRRSRIVPPSSGGTPPVTMRNGSPPVW